MDAKTFAVLSQPFCKKVSKKNRYKNSPVLKNNTPVQIQNSGFFNKELWLSFLKRSIKPMPLKIIIKVLPVLSELVFRLVKPCIKNKLITANRPNH
jgi:hypothetical protein